MDLIFSIVCQISGQDNVSYKSENHIGIFKTKTFVLDVFVVLTGAKGYCRIFVLTRVLLVTAFLKIALRC